jgi:hypothetical protein
LTEEKPIQVKVELSGETAKRFIKIKEKWGFKTNAETIRFLIAQEYDRLER